MGNIFRLSSILTLDTKTFTTKLSAASKRFGRATRTILKQSKQIGRSFKMAGKDLMFLAGPPLAALTLFGKRFATNADEIGKLSKQTGISTAALQEFSHVAALSGIEFTKWVDAIKYQQDYLSSGTSHNIIKKMGLDPESLKQLAPEQAFQKLIGVIGGVENATDRTSFAMDLWGRSGANMLRMVQDGEAGLAKMRQEFRDLGGVIDNKTIKATEAFNDNMTRVKAIATGVGNTIMTSLLPHLDSTATKAIENGKAFRKWTDENKEIVDSFTNISLSLLGGGVAGAGILFGIGQLSFALHSIIKVLTLFKTANLMSALSMVPMIAGLGAVAFALSLANKEFREYIKNSKWGRRIPAGAAATWDAAVAKAEQYGGNVGAYVGKTAANIGAELSGNVSNKKRNEEVYQELKRRNAVEAERTIAASLTTVYEEPPEVESREDKKVATAEEQLEVLKNMGDGIMDLVAKLGGGSPAKREPESAY